jgi:hypothetical protein
MADKKFYEMHRSDVIYILLAKERYPQLHTNIQLAELLEGYFPKKERSYIVKEDDLPLENGLDIATF